MAVEGAGIERELDLRQQPERHRRAAARAAARLARARPRRRPLPRREPPPRGRGPCGPSSTRPSTRACPAACQLHRRHLCESRPRRVLEHRVAAGRDVEVVRVRRGRRSAGRRSRWRAPPGGRRRHCGSLSWPDGDPEPRGGRSRSRRRTAPRFASCSGSRPRRSIRNQSLAEATLVAGQATERHYHRLAEEIYFLLEGGGLMEVDGVEREVGPGDAILIPPGAWHSLQRRRRRRTAALHVRAAVHARGHVLLLGRATRQQAGETRRSDPRVGRATRVSWPDLQCRRERRVGLAFWPNRVEHRRN